jgi:two-component sensor histidine kinase
MSDEVRVQDHGAPPTSVAGDGFASAGADGAGRLQALEADLARTRALLHEADHRAKNTLQVVTSLVLLQARRVGSQPSPRVLYAIAERINALSLVHRLLSQEETGRFPVAVFLRELAGELQGGDRVAITFDLAAVDLPAAKAPSLGLLLHEILTNALQHAFPDGAPGRVAVSLAAQDGRAVVAIADDGIGFPETPADGFGLMLVDLLGRQLRATVSREPAAPGTRVTVAVPLGAEGQLEGARRP